jgi:hypothetical protein
LNTENRAIVYPPLIHLSYGTQPALCPNEQVPSTLIPIDEHNQNPHAVFGCWLEKADHKVLLKKYQCKYYHGYPFYASGGRGTAGLLSLGYGLSVSLT